MICVLVCIFGIIGVNPADAKKHNLKSIKRILRKNTADGD